MYSLLSKNHLQNIYCIQSGVYRVEPDTNVTTLHLLGFHINEEKSSDTFGKQTNNAIKDRAV